MKINLAEIPEEGRDFHYDRETGELNEILEDLVHREKYSIDFTIRPMGNAYELRGKLQTRLPDVCSKCGDEMSSPIDHKFHEILLEEQEDYRKSHSVHGNQSVDFLAQTPSVSHYQGNIFEAGEFLHEEVALAGPLYPVCGMQKCVREAEIDNLQKQLEENFKAATKDIGESPFAVLKDFHPKS